MLIPNSYFIPLLPLSSLVTMRLFSMFVSLFVFYKEVFLYHFLKVLHMSVILWYLSFSKTFFSLNLFFNWEWPQRHHTYTLIYTRGKKTTSPTEQVWAGMIEGHRAVFWLHRESRWVNISAIYSNIMCSLLCLKTSRNVSSGHLIWITNNWYVSRNSLHVW